MPNPNLSDPKYFEILPEFMKKSMNRERFYWRWDTPQKYQVNMRAYFRMLSGIDNVVGRLVDTLEEKGLAENTVIIYTADNGYFMGDRGFAGKWNHYEQSLRVPLIVCDRRLPEPQRERIAEAMALNIDLAPTLLELGQVDIPEHYQGRSLMPFMRTPVSKSGDWRNAFFCEHLMDNALIPKWEGVRTSRYKYARYFEQSPVFEFLHDLETDTNELENLVSNAQYRHVLARLRQTCDQLRDLYTDAQKTR